MLTRTFFLTWLIVAGFALSANAQDAESSDETPPETRAEPARDTEPVVEKDADEANAEDDIFTPSEHISEDYAVPYPTDI